MLVRRLTVIIFLLFLTSACSLAQRFDASFTGGWNKVSDSTVIFTVGCTVPPASCPPPAFRDHLKTDNHYYVGGSMSVHLLDVKPFSFRLEVPAAAVPPTQHLTLPSTPAFVSDITSIFVTPSVMVKLAPDFWVSPWVSAGGGWAHYTVDPDIATNKGALQFGGGFDVKVGLKRLRLRAEIRDFLTGDPTIPLVSGPFTGTAQGGLHRHNIMAGGGVVLHF